MFACLIGTPKATQSNAAQSTAEQQLSLAAPPQLLACKLENKLLYYILAQLLSQSGVTHLQQLQVLPLGRPVQLQPHPQAELVQRGTEAAPETGKAGRQSSPQLRRHKEVHRLEPMCVLAAGICLLKYHH
jgi:hypothetical protein